MSDTPAAQSAHTPAKQQVTADDFDALNRVVSPSLDSCDAVQSSPDLPDYRASALGAAVDLLKVGREALQRYTVAPQRNG